MKASNSSSHTKVNSDQDVNAICNHYMIMMDSGWESGNCDVVPNCLKVGLTRFTNRWIQKLFNKKMPITYSIKHESEEKSENYQECESSDDEYAETDYDLTLNG